MPSQRLHDRDLLPLPLRPRPHPPVRRALPRALDGRSSPTRRSLLDAICPQQHSAAVEVKEDLGKGKKARQAAQRYIVVIRDKDGWCKRTVKYLYGLAW